MQCLKNINHLGRESLRDPPKSVPLTDFSEIPGQDLTASRLYGQTSPDAPTRDFMIKPYSNKAKKGD